jgi:hypothetical protein
MKLDEDLFQANMNTVELEGKKVLDRPSQAKSTKDKEVVIGEDRHQRIIMPKNLEIGRWKKERSKPRSHPKVTFDILMAKYRDSRANVRGHKNRTIQFSKLDHLISLDQASTSATERSSNQQPRTP